MTPLLHPHQCAVLVLALLFAVPPSQARDTDACAGAGASARPLTTENYRIPSDTTGIELFIRNKRPADIKIFPSARVLLYVHGATYPSETAFDLPLGGFSWMDYLACRGFDVYLVDLRGYGQSTRPPEMERPAADYPPIVTTEVALRDVGAAVDHILKRRGLDKINLLGWSWGTVIMATYTARNSGKVNRLVLYAPLWLTTEPPLVGADGPLGAYRTVTKENARKRWYANVPEAKQKDLIPPGWFDAWAEATWATDPAGAQSGLLRAPNGVVQDVREYWSAGRPSYDPAKIEVPVFLAHAEWDADTPSYMAQTLFGLLVNAPWKRMVQIGQGTHSVIMETNRLQLFREVQLFLEEER